MIEVNSFDSLDFTLNFIELDKEGGGKNFIIEL